MIEHHIEACTKISGLSEVLIIGSYAASDLQQFVQETIKKYKITIRYLQEFTPLGTAGGMYHFRDQIRAGCPENFFVMNGDVCADFPLQDLLESHRESKALLTIMATEATRQQSLNYGCIVLAKDGKVSHYVEKPSTFVSTLINCGVYLVSPEIFPTMAEVFYTRHQQDNIMYAPNGTNMQLNFFFCKFIHKIMRFLCTTLPIKFLFYNIYKVKVKLSTVYTNCIRKALFNRFIDLYLCLFMNFVYIRSIVA